VMLVFSTMMIILAFYRMKRLSGKMTAQIIYLYETLYQIASNHERKGAVELSFKQSSKELNELHLTFNRVARTINLASQSMSP
jgi:tetratricopeptide (TPR) repeat protein